MGGPVRGGIRYLPLDLTHQASAVQTYHDSRQQHPLYCVYLQCNIRNITDRTVSGSDLLELLIDWLIERQVPTLPNTVNPLPSPSIRVYQSDSSSSDVSL